MWVWVGKSHSEREVENKESQFLFVTWQASMGRSNNRNKYTDVIGTL